MFVDNVFMLLLWGAGISSMFMILALIADPFIDPWLDKNFPESDTESSKEAMK